MVTMIKHISVKAIAIRVACWIVGWYGMGHLFSYIGIAEPYTFLEAVVAGTLIGSFDYYATMKYPKSKKQNAGSM